MKTLNQKNNRVLVLLFGKFLNESDATKKSNLQNEIVAKFGIEHFENCMKNVPVSVPTEKVKKVKKSKAITEAEMQNENSDAEINNELLSALNAHGITEKLISAKGGKSIFKKEFNTKNDRTKCRNLFHSAMSRCLLHLAHDKKDLAKKEFEIVKLIAEKYYLAESTFKNASDYFSSNMGEDKKFIIQTFINNVEKVSA